MFLRPLAGGAQDEGGYGVEFVGDGTQAQSARLEGNAAAARCGVQRQRVWGSEVVLQPCGLGGRGVVGEGARHGVALLEALAGFSGGGDALRLLDDALVRSHSAQEFVSIGVGVEQ